jgi:predicted metal-dependent phosphoesterase TrpH
MLSLGADPGPDPPASDNDALEQLEDALLELIAITEEWPEEAADEIERLLELLGPEP